MSPSVKEVKQKTVAKPFWQFFCHPVYASAGSKKNSKSIKKNKHSCYLSSVFFTFLFATQRNQLFPAMTIAIQVNNIKTQTTQNL